MKINRLEELRKEKGLAQKEVAKYLGISSPAYSHYETGFTEPNVSNLIKLSNLYKLSIDYILGLTNERKVHSFINLFKKLNPNDQSMLIRFAERLIKGS